MIDVTRRPVLNGFLALVAVSVAIGVITGIGAIIGVSVSGFGAESGSGGATSEVSMFLPKPDRSALATDSPPEITDGSTTPPAEAEEAIVLEAAQTAVGPMDQIDLSGTYPDGDGAILQVQRWADGTWIDFPVSAAVNGDSFATYVQTSQLGVNKFRVFDRATENVSNVVKVTIS